MNLEVKVSALLVQPGSVTGVANPQLIFFFNRNILLTMTFSEISGSHSGQYEVGGVM
jgi:hypothetical protein